MGCLAAPFGSLQQRASSTASAHLLPCAMWKASGKLEHLDTQQEYCMCMAAQKPHQQLAAIAMAC